MKTKLLAGLIGACFTVPVLAQSSITIYGVADAGVMMTSNGEGRVTKLVSGMAEGSRIGFKGMEDIGGGFKAVFTLEARVELDTGSNKTGNYSSNQGYALTKGMDFALAGPAGAALLATLRGPDGLQPTLNVNATSPLVLQRGGGPDGGIFDRTAMVGLITPVGAVLAGRMYSPAYEIFAKADAFETGTAGSWAGVATGTGGLLTTGMAIRSNKSLQYRMELPNGLGGALMYGFKNSGYVGLDKNFVALNLFYKANGFDAGIGYNRGTNMCNPPNGVSLNCANGFDGSRGLVTLTAGGSYTMGNMKFFAGYQDMKNDNSLILPVFKDYWDNAVRPGLAAKSEALAAGLTASFKNNLTKNFKLDADSYQLGMHYGLGSGRIMGSVSYQNDRTAFNSDATQYAIGYDHNLSKRTDIYTVLAYIKNENGAQYASGGQSASGGFTAAPGESGRALQVGIRHKF